MDSAKIKNLSRPHLQTHITLLCFTFSGFAALLYQITFVRLFAISFGTSDIAIGIVLATYMAGLALGANVASRFVHKVDNPVLTFSLLEASIAITALILPSALAQFSDIYIWFNGDQPTPQSADSTSQFTFFFCASFVILLVPTSLMGATLPFLARYLITSDGVVGSRISFLYAANTTGAILGVLVTAFYLLPTFGLKQTILFGVAANSIAVAISLALAFEDPPSLPNRPSLARNRSAFRGYYHSILPLIFVSGAVSFVYEILWTRLLSHVLGGSIYAYATMLSAFLAGLSIGSIIAGFLANDRARAMRFFGACQIGIAISSALVFITFERLNDLLGAQWLLAFSTMIPSAVFIGATYPFAVRAYAYGRSDAGAASAIVFSLNSFGAVLGATIGALILIPNLQFVGTIKAAVITNLFVGLTAFLRTYTARQPRHTRALTRALSLGLVYLAVTFYKPERPIQLIVSSSVIDPSRAYARELHYSVGRASTVVVSEGRWYMNLITNGLIEAQIDFLGSPPITSSQRMLGLWPSLARKNIQSLAVVGLGGGVALEDVPKTVQSIHTIELEREVINANASISHRRAVNPLDNSRHLLIVNDARNALRLTQRKYDAVISQPSHPWTAGASHLYTREFFSLVKSRLVDDGVLVQWMALTFVDETLLCEFTATLLSEFRYVYILQPVPEVLHFLASDVEIDFISRGQLVDGNLKDHHLLFQRNGIAEPSDVLAAVLLDEDGTKHLASNCRAVTDDFNQMAFGASQFEGASSTEHLNRIADEFDILIEGHDSLLSQLDSTAIVDIATKLISVKNNARLARLIDNVDSQPLGNMLRGMMLHSRGLRSQADQLLSLISADDPMYEESVYLRIVSWLPWIDIGAISIEEFGHFDSKTTVLGAILEGRRMLNSKNWAALAALDEQLGKSRPNALSGPSAAHLMASWRLNTSSDGDHALVYEAINLIDISLAKQQNKENYALRAKIGLRLDDTAMFVESAAHYARLAKVSYGEIEGLPLENLVDMHSLREINYLLRELESKISEHSSSRTTFAHSELRAARQIIESRL